MNTFATKKIILACVLASSAASAFAEWTSVAETSQATYYIDLSTIRKDGVMRKVWGIHDLKKLESNGWASVRSRNEYDCKEERYRALSLSSHSEPMAGGTAMFTNRFENPDSWRQIPPGTDVEAIMKIVCAR